MSEMQFESTGKASKEELENLLAEELSKRRVAAAVVPTVATVGGKQVIQESLLNTLMNELNDIRENPELRKKNTDEMVRTYEKYLEQGNNPVEIFVPNDKNYWAAGRTKDNQDVVYYDPTAPHAPVMAHELGHVEMNDPDSNDFLSLLQKSGIGRASGKLAPFLGVAGGLAGYRAVPKNRFAGAALGTGTASLLSSGNFAYELGGATGRAMDYLPEDVDQEDAYGDLFRAGMTYGMGGPGMALAMGSGAATSHALIDRMTRKNIY